MKNVKSKNKNAVGTKKIPEMIVLIKILLSHQSTKKANPERFALKKLFQTLIWQVLKPSPQLRRFCCCLFILRKGQYVIIAILNRKIF